MFINEITVNIIYIIQRYTIQKKKWTKADECHKYNAIINAIVVVLFILFFMLICNLYYPQL